MKNCAVSIALLLLMSVTAAAQGRGGGNQTTGQYAIRGRLVFSTAKHPEDRIEVVLERNMQRVGTTFTDSLGQFEFTGLSPSDYQVIVRLADYEDVNQTVSIFASQMNTSVSIPMNPLFSVVRKRNAGFEGDDPDVVDVSQISKTYPKKALQEYQKGLDENRKGATQKAIPHFEQATKIAPDFFNAWNNLGMAYVREQRFADGEAALKKARELNPKSHQPLLNLAIAYISESDQHRSEGRNIYGKYLDDAMDCLEAALKIRPTSVMSHYYLGMANYKSDFYEEAEVSLKRALDLDSEFGGTRVILVNIYLKQRRLKEALAQIDAFLKEHPRAEERPAMEGLRQKVLKGIETPHE